ncbi:MAG TPA: hypothetical protein PLZ74_09155, partial [Kiritimatiellia bacterium]|nr:hypothetical protein [Kiritimatiellia bacterium]
RSSRVECRGSRVDDPDSDSDTDTDPDPDLDETQKPETLKPETLKPKSVAFNALFRFTHPRGVRSR